MTKHELDERCARSETARRAAQAAWWSGRGGANRSELWNVYQAAIVAQSEAENEWVNHVWPTERGEK